MPASRPVPASLYDLLHARTARLPVTYGLIAVNAVVFVLMLHAGAGLGPGDSGIQLAWGANFGPATQDGQWWRLGSALFLHFGLFHIAMNLWALWDAGQLVERIYGHGRFALLYFGAGLAGNLLSLVVQGNEAVSGGASGAVFGLYGALLVFLWRERRHIDRHEFRWLFRTALAFTAVSIGLGFAIPGIDNSAHIGGLLAGALLGVLLGRPLLGERAWPRPLRALAALLLAAAVGGLALRLPEPAYSWHEEMAARDEIRAFLEREGRIQDSWQDILRQDRHHEQSIQQLAERIEAEIGGPYEASLEQFTELSLSPASPSAAQLDHLRAYSEQRRDSAQAMARQLRARGQFGPRPPPRLGPPLSPPAHFPLPAARP